MQNGKTSKSTLVNFKSYLKMIFDANHFGMSLYVHNYIMLAWINFRAIDKVLWA